MKFIVVDVNLHKFVKLKNFHCKGIIGLTICTAPLSLYHWDGDEWFIQKFICVSDHPIVLKKQIIFNLVW